MIDFGIIAVSLGVFSHLIIDRNGNATVVTQNGSHLPTEMSYADAVANANAKLIELSLQHSMFGQPDESSH